MSSRGSHASGGYENGMAVEEAIIAQLKELDLVARRDIPADERDDYELQQVYEDIENNIIVRDSDAARKARLSEILIESLCLRQLILYLRGWHPVNPEPTFYFENAMRSLMRITELTYNLDYRKTAIVLGVVEAGAEMLVLEVRRWGPAASLQQEHVNGKGRNERREVRKQIASVLTNLTFGSASMKRLVSEYDGFMDVVIEIIHNAPNLVPPYANLLRNVSWPSCKGMGSLFAATPALTRAAVLAHQREDDKSVKSTLSAIWNIVGSGGEECVRIVVEMEGCVDMLIQLLTLDAQRTMVVEYSTGILKYASQELVRGEKLEHCIHLRLRLIPRLLPLLRASSMTIVKNSLWAVREIAAKDPTTVGKCMTPSAMESLGKLQCSNDNEIRRPAKEILSRIGAGDYSGGMMSRSAHVGNGRDMSSSMRSDRLLPLRSPYAHSPALGGMPNGVGVSSSEAPCSPRASSVPRHFQQEGMRTGGGGMSSSLYGGTVAGGQYTMGSPSPLYGNMESIRAAAQQQAQQQQQIRLQQQQREMQHLQQQQQQPSSFFGGAPPPHPIPQGFPVPSAFAPPPGMAPPPSFPSSFPSTSFAPPPYSKGAADSAVAAPMGTVQHPFGANGPPTLQYEDREGEEGQREYYDDEEEDELSTQVTRSGSMESLDGDGQGDISGFHSNVETANNSCRLSPVSYSDLPDSPTQCAAPRDSENALQLHLPSFPIPSSTLGNSVPFGMGPSSSAGGSSGTDGSSGGLSSSQTNSSHTTPHATSAEQTPTFSTLNARYTMDYDTPRVDVLRIAASAAAASSAPSTSNGPVADVRRDDEDEDDYGVYGDDDLLDRSIQEALPQRIEEKKERVNSFLLHDLSAALPSSRSPSSKGSSRYSNTSTIREDDILAAAIESAMPKVGSLSSPRGTLLMQSKNGTARWSERPTHSTTEGHNMSEQRRDEEEEEEETEDSDLDDGYPMGGSLVGTMPRDVEEEMEAERIAIDCSSLRRKPRPPRTSLLPRQLATPTSSRTSRQTMPPVTSTERPSPRPSSIGRPRPLTSTPNTSRNRLTKFPSTPRVSAVTLPTGTPNGNSHLEATPPLSTNVTATPPTISPAPSSTSSSMSRLKKPTASAVVPPYNYQKPKTVPREEKKGSCPKGEKEVEKTNGQMLVTTV